MATLYGDDDLNVSDSDHDLERFYELKEGPLESEEDLLEERLMVSHVR